MVPAVEGIIFIYTSSPPHPSFIYLFRATKTLFSGVLTVLIDKCLPVTYSRYEPCHYLLNITQF